MDVLFVAQRAPSPVFGQIWGEPPPPDASVSAVVVGTVGGSVSAYAGVSDPADIDVAAAIIGVIGGTFDAQVGASIGSSASASEIWSYILPNGLPAGQVFSEIRGWLAELHKIHGLTAGSPLAVTQTTRTAGDISQTITDSAGVVTVTRN